MVASLLDDHLTTQLFNHLIFYPRPCNSRSPVGLSKNPPAVHEAIRWLVVTSYESRPPWQTLGLKTPLSDLAPSVITQGRPVSVCHKLIATSESTAENPHFADSSDSLNPTGKEFFGNGNSMARKQPCVFWISPIRGDSSARRILLTLKVRMFNPSGACVLWWPCYFASGAVGIWQSFCEEQKNCIRIHVIKSCWKHNKKIWTHL